MRMSAPVAPPTRAAHQYKGGFTSSLSVRALRRGAGQLLPSPKATPLATAVLSSLLVAALLLRTHPGDISTVVAWASTNVHNLAHHPVAAMLASTLVVPGSLLPELAIVAVSFAVLERGIGARRTVVVALSGQVIATLLTEYGTDLGAHLHLLTESSAERSDVGVSYVMYSVSAASLLLLADKVRVVALTALSTCVVASLLISPGMTATGHVLSVAIGAATMMLLQRFRAPAAPDAGCPGAWIASSLTDDGIHG